jgi:hypothetical protein
MMVARSSYCGVHPSIARARSEAATIWAGSPGRRGAILILKSTPETRLIQQREALGSLGAKGRL